MPSMLARIIHPRRIRRRDEYISGSSLSSSLEMSNRLSEAVLNASPPLSMRFHKKWQHDECLVMKWYREQTQAGLPTKFTSIEHMRVLQPPFHHEYLLIHLVDGAICRLERMGEGARADAVRPLGCTAHDIIQRFADGAYYQDNLSKVESERLIQVEFPHAFDLLDVLAICYCMQRRVKRSSVYTLQRYNCYFLCMTVLNLLVRRIARWHTTIDKASWSEVVKNTMRSLQTMECTDAYEYMGLGICSLVDPNSSNPRKFLLDAIEKELSGSGLYSLSEAVHETLWHKDLGYAIHGSLSFEIGNAVSEVLEGPSAKAIQLKTLLTDEAFRPAPVATEIKTHFQQELENALYNRLARSLRNSAKSAAATYSMREIEEPTPFSHRLSYRLSAVIGCLGIFAGFGDDSGFGYLEELPFFTRAKHVARLFPTFLFLAKMRSYNPEGLHDEEIEDFFGPSMQHAEIIAAYETLQSQTDEAREQSLGAIGNSDFIDEESWALCLGICVGRRIDEVVRKHCQSVEMFNIDNPQDSRLKHTSVAQFQEYTRQRIQNHATRVASYGLAAAKLVQSEIEITMAKIWKQTLLTIDDSDSDLDSDSGSEDSSSESGEDSEPAD